MKGGRLDARTLSEVMGGTLSLGRYQELLPAYEKAMQYANINTPKRAAMFAAQLGHESVGLKYQSEIWGPTAAQRTYDGRMGNRRGTSDWSDFRGHGWIQITGRDNHTACSVWAFEAGIVPTRDFFVVNPAALGSDEYCWVGPVWYWTQARPQLNHLSDIGDLEGVTRAINGGLNGLADRRTRYGRALKMGDRLLPGDKGDVMEKVLDYSRSQVTQDTYYNCGPASVQTVLQAVTGGYFTESEIGRKLGTHTGGTDYIGSFPAVLNEYLPGAEYAYRNVPNYLNSSEKDVFWERIVNSIDSGFGVIVNIVAPPNNYPRAVYPSTISPAYRGGTVYHYFAVMGYSTDGQRRVWVADSGFSPFGYWLSFEQLCSLVVPKGYAFSTVVTESGGDLFMSLSRERQEDIAGKIDRIHHELTHDFESRYVNVDGSPSTFRDTLIGYVLELDRKVEDIHHNMLPTIYSSLISFKDRVIGFFKGDK